MLMEYVPKYQNGLLCQFRNYTMNEKSNEKSKDAITNELLDMLFKWKAIVTMNGRQIPTYSPPDVATLFWLCFDSLSDFHVELHIIKLVNISNFKDSC